MPKGSRKSGGKNWRQLAQHCTRSDFTVYDFANAEPSDAKSGRPRKGEMRPWTKPEEVSAVASEVANSKDSLAWYEKDLSDFDLTDSESLASEEAEQQKKDLSRKKHRRKTDHHTEDDDGLIYPYDLWCILSDYIQPEDVSTFGRICRSAHIITHSAKFWFSLYRRFYVQTPDLPVTLRPECIDRLHGLRSRITRALYFMHTPFQDKIRNNVAFNPDPDTLRGACCILMWHQQVKSHWHFFLKFVRANKNPCIMASKRSDSASSPASRKAHHRDSLLDEADIHYNPEENRVILQIVARNFISLPPSVMGQYLSKASVSVGHGMRYHKLKMLFSPQPYMLSGGDRHGLAGGCTHVVMDPVINAYVLNWWDPKYPHMLA